MATVTGLVLAIWVTLAVLGLGLALAERGQLAEEELDATLAALTPQARCCDCGDTFPADEVELHYLLRHPDSEDAWGPSP